LLVPGLVVPLVLFAPVLVAPEPAPEPAPAPAPPPLLPELLPPEPWAMTAGAIPTRPSTRDRAMNFFTGSSPLRP
jgi:hypothetical protein